MTLTEDVAKSVVANDRPRVNRDILSKHTACVQRDTWVQPALRANSGALSDKTVSADLRAFADDDVVLDNSIRADSDAMS